MSTGPAFWLIMTVAGAILLGIALAYGLISTRKRRENPLAQRLTNAATRELYREEEARRVHQEGAATEDERPAMHPHAISATEARQGVTGQNVNYVLGASLILAGIAAIGLGYLWMHPELLGGQ
jgi:Flp pilus assembly protein TadB